MTGTFRVSYPYVLKKNDNDKYAIAMLFDEKTLRRDAKEMSKFKELKAIVQEELDKHGFSKEQGPFRLGDEKKEKDGTPSAVYAGKIYAEAKTNFEPELFDRNKQDIISEKEFPAGCYARARVNAYRWDYKNKSGVALGFDAVQKLGDALPTDPAISSKAPAKEDFDDLDGDVASTDDAGTDDDLLM